MEKLIDEADIFHDDDDKGRKYQRELDKWRSDNQKNVTSSQLLAAIKLLKKKLMQDACPTFNTGGWDLAAYLFHRFIGWIADELVNENKISLTDLHSAYLDVTIEWLQNGAATIHLKIIKEMYSNNDFDEYVQALTGPAKDKFVTALISPIVKREATSDTQFYKEHQCYLKRMVRDSFEDSFFEDHKNIKVWLLHAFHLYLDYMHLEEDPLYQVIGEGKDRYDEISDQMQEFNDQATMKELIKKLIAGAKTPGFPSGSQAEQAFRGPMKILNRKLKAPGDAEIYSDLIFDLMEALSLAKGNEKCLIDTFDVVVDYIDDQDRDVIKKRDTFFKAVAPRFKKLTETIDMKFLEQSCYSRDIVSKLEHAYSNNKTLAADWISLSIPLLKRVCYNNLRAAAIVLGRDDAIRWKDHKPVAQEIFQLLCQVQIPKIEDPEKLEKYIKEYKSCVTNFIRGLEKGRILKDYGEGLMFLGINILELKINQREVFELAEEIGEHIEINLKDKKTEVMEVMKRIHLLLKDDNLPWTESWPLQRAVEDTIKSIIEDVTDGRIFSDQDLKVFTAMCYTCLSKEGLNYSDNSLSAHFIIGSAILKPLMNWMSSTKRLGYAVSLIPLLLEKYEEEEQNVSIISGTLLNAFASGEAATMTPYLEQLLKLYLDKEDTSILMPINTTYPFNPEPMKPHFQEMIHQLIDSRDPQVLSWMVQIFYTASKKQPELFTEQNMKDIIEMAKSNDQYHSMLMQIMQEVCKRKPERMIKFIDLLMDKNSWKQMTVILTYNMLSTLALYDGKQAPKVLEYLLKTTKSTQEKGELVTLWNTIRIIGFKYPDIIKIKRQEIVSIPTADPDAQTIKQTVLDMIDGKTPDDLKKQLEEQQTALDDLVDRVEEVEVVVVAVKDDLDQQGQELDNVKNEVTEQGQRLDKVEETVDDTVAKVEEIDSKTLSHAPYWSRDVSKLLNPMTDHDWRLLSSRLGYSNDDIRAWAQQADPCMAMLNEWYATRKTSEASYAVLTNLQEMDRMDAALIVENAMKKADAVVEDEEFEYASPPEIFLSYQWGHQEEVKLLHRHLEMAGYTCWMDIGQMGGGDKLFEKIDNGMRAAKLVISCITTKYAKSPNCNREVNLAVGVNKPVIPLLLERCTWPPPGSMGPIFSESLYIQFFLTGKQETVDNRFWPEEKFQELLMQLSANGLTPDEGKIDPMYRDWWMPLEDEIQIDKSKTRDGGKPEDVTSSSAEKVDSPEVFISYQWDKQKNIIKLYQQLTSLGFSCWLDIKQMGGGDSLYDKIDKGIRNCKVVLSCVTKKYSLSANCRREVSLTDALKKPLLPLLLEDMVWPPTGPMSMVLTQLLYIDFKQEEAHTSWQGSQFEELVQKINQHLPNAVVQDKSTAGDDSLNKDDTKDGSEDQKMDEKKDHDKKQAEPQSSGETTQPSEACSPEMPPADPTPAPPKPASTSAQPRSKSCSIL